MRARVLSCTSRAARRRGLTVLEALVGDGTGSVLAVWYNQDYLKTPFSERPEVLLRGQLVRRGGLTSFAVKRHEILGGGDEGVHTLGLVPVYPATGELSVRTIRSLLLRVAPEARHLVDPLPASLLAAPPVRAPRGRPVDLSLPEQPAGGAARPRTPGFRGAAPAAARRPPAPAGGGSEGTRASSGPVRRAERPLPGGPAVRADRSPEPGPARARRGSEPRDAHAPPFAGGCRIGQDLGRHLRAAAGGRGGGSGGLHGTDRGPGGSARRPSGRAARPAGPGAGAAEGEPAGRRASRDRGRSRLGRAQRGGGHARVDPRGRLLPRPARGRRRRAAPVRSPPAGGPGRVRARRSRTPHPAHDGDPDPADPQPDALRRPGPDGDRRAACPAGSPSGRG